MWSPNGSELFFQGSYEGTQKLMVVSVAADRETLQLGTPTPLLDMSVTGPDGREYVYAMASYGLDFRSLTSTFSCRLRKETP